MVGIRCLHRLRLKTSLIGLPSPTPPWSFAGRWSAMERCTSRLAHAYAVACWSLRRIRGLWRRGERLSCVEYKGPVFHQRWAAHNSSS
eukprot:1885236-Ditylum_brightwellii.AAC.1